MRYLLMSVCLVAILGNADDQPAQFKTSVEPRPTDNLARPCAFDFSIPAPQKPARGYADLKRCLLIPSLVIFDSRVCRGMPSLVAAPDGPEIRPLHSANAVSIISLS